MANAITYRVGVGSPETTDNVSTPQDLITQLNLSGEYTARRRGLDDTEYQTIPLSAPLADGDCLSLTKNKVGA